jgi:hypothetical protein
VIHYLRGVEVTVFLIILSVLSMMAFIAHEWYRYTQRSGPYKSERKTMSTNGTLWAIFWPNAHFILLSVEAMGQNIPFLVSFFLWLLGCLVMMRNTKNRWDFDEFWGIGDQITEMFSDLIATIKKKFSSGNGATPVSLTKPTPAAPPAAPVKKADPVKKTDPAKKADPAKKTVPAKKALPAKKAVPTPRDLAHFFGKKDAQDAPVKDAADKKVIPAEQETGPAIKVSDRRAGIDRSGISVFKQP